MIEVALASWGAAWSTVATVSMLRWRRAARRHAAAPTTSPRVWLLRPCSAGDPGLAENLASTSLAVAGHRGACTSVFTVDSAADPTWPVVQHVADAVGARAVVAEGPGHNRKVAQLAAATEALPIQPEDVVVVVDSDVDLTDYDLDALVGPVASGEFAAAWSPPVERGPRTAGDRISAAILGASLHSFALLGALDRRGLVGKTLAISAAALSEVGGWAALRDVLAEDMALARRLAARGRAVTMVVTPTRSTARGRRLSAVVDRYTRWLVALRRQRPGLLSSYPLLLAAAPLLLLAGLALLAVAPVWGLALMATVVLARTAVAAVARRATGAPRLLPWWWLGADAVLLWCAARAVVSPRVQWRGRMLEVDRGGTLTPAA